MGAETCRDCALPWVAAPCGNCGSQEPATPDLVLGEAPATDQAAADPPARRGRRRAVDG